jgi:tetratricopeptide (TPR) repeat protein
MPFWSRSPRPSPASDQVEKAADDFEEEVHCALCDAVRADVRRLVAGRSGAVCDRCIRSALWMLDDDEESGPGHATSPALASLIVAMMESDPVPASFARTNKLGDAALELAGGDVTLVRRVGVAALARSNASAALRAFAAIPRDVRTLTDRINLSIAHYLTGDLEGALEAIPAVSEAQTRSEAILLLLNRASYALLRVPPPRAEELAQLREQLEAALDLEARPPLHLDDGSAPSPTSYRDNIEGSIAHVEFLLKDLDAAEARLRRLNTIVPSASQLLLLGDILWAKGESNAARSQWQAALEAAHPESRDAATAKERLAPEYR